MSPAVVLARLRRFLLLFSALLFVGALAELWLANHTGDFVQLIPFALCALGLIAVFAVLFAPRRASVLFLMASMGLIILGSLYGVYEHFINNMAFQREVYPNATQNEIVKAAVSGANPLLAPGLLAAAAVLSLAAVYQHPSVTRSEETERES